MCDKNELIISIQVWTILKITSLGKLAWQFFGDPIFEPKYRGSQCLNYENAPIRLRFGGQGPFTLISHQKNFQANRSNGLGFLAIFNTKVLGLS